MSQKTKTTNTKTKKEDLAALGLPALFAHLGAHDGAALFTNAGTMGA